MPTATQDQSRADFEACPDLPPSLRFDKEPGGRYKYHNTRIAWKAWQAAWNRRAAQSSAWQPIETAPKDGRVLWLGYYNAHGNWRALRGEWVSADQIAECCEEEAEPGWYETAVEAEDPPNAWATSPTHWRPLPKPPTDKGAPDD